MSGGGDYWITDVPKAEYKMFDPWPPAFAQSRGISVLLHGYQLSGAKKYLDAATRALRIFRIPVGEGGVTSFTRFGPIYEEYPASFLTGVLDGAIFSLFGLFDYLRAVPPDSPQARRLFEEGLSALRNALPRYDLGFWIKYNLCDQPFYPPPPRSGNDHVLPDDPHSASVVAAHLRRTVFSGMGRKMATLRPVAEYSLNVLAEVPGVEAAKSPVTAGRGHKPWGRADIFILDLLSFIPHFPLFPF